MDVVFCSFFRTVADTNPDTIPLFTLFPGILFGLIALAFCFQEESVSFLTTSFDSKSTAFFKINRGFILTGVLLTGNVVFGGISYAAGDTNAKGDNGFSITEYYIGRISIPRVVICLVVFFMYIPMVPTVSLKAASNLLKINGSEPSSNSVVKLISVFIVLALTWIFFLPRYLAFHVFSVSGGIIGFVFIFLVPILLHWKYTGDSTHMEQKLNRESPAMNLIGLAGQALPESESADTFTSTHLGNFGLLCFTTIGVLCLLLPILKVCGLPAN